MRSASLLSMLLVILMGRLPTAQAEENVRTERFDRDPGWDSQNNWTPDRKPVQVTQDFGYSQTNHARGKSAGEVGGGIVRSSRTAFYLKPLGRVMTLDEPLRVAGQFVVAESDGLSSLYFGFCNSQTIGGPYPRNWLVITFSGESNGCEVGVGYISDLGNGDGKRATGVGPKGAAVRDFNRIPDGTVYTFDLRYDPQANDGQGRILFTLGGDGPFTAKDVEVNVHPEFRQGMQFDSFGFCNSKAEPGSTLAVYFDDLTINGEALPFDEDPNWNGQNNRVTYEDSFKRGAHDFGYQADSKFAGGEPGEMGGVLFSDNAGYYGDDVGRLTLDDRLVASGKMALTERASEAGFYLGWFNSKERGYPPQNLIGVWAEGPNSTGSMFRPIYASSDPQLADTLKYTTPIDPFGKVYQWRIEFDPAAADGAGELKVTLGGESAVLTLTPEARRQNAQFDRFGLAVYEGGGQWSQVFFDDLEYTVGTK
jgi:hypothetical protein